MADTTRSAASSGTWLERVADVFLPSWIEGGPNERVMRAYYWMRIGPASAAVVLAVVVPGLDSEIRRRVLVVIGAIALPYLLIVSILGIRRPSPLVRLTTVAGDLLPVLGVQVAVPALQFPVLLGYLVFTGFYSYMGGLTGGLVVAGTSIAFAGTAAALGFGSVDALTLGIWGVVLIAIVFMLDAASRAQRMATERLARLHDALKRISAPVALDDTLDALASTARDELGASFILILLDGEERRIGAVGGDAPGDGELAEAALRGASPSLDALSLGAPVLIREISAERHYPEWSAAALRRGLRSMVALPLTTGGRTLGVLSAYFTSSDGVSDAGVDLLTAFAGQATIALERASAYERERLAAERLREVDRMKDEFLATVSHELRTPLTSIQGFASTLGSRWDRLDDGTRLELIEYIRQNSEELRFVIEQLLDLSKVAAGRVELKLEDLPLGPFIERFVAANDPAIEAGRVDVRVAPDLVARVDTGGLERVLSNLLGNAAKFSGDGVPVDVTAEAAENEIVISIRDRGPGIADEDKERIFGAFARAEDASGVPGTGIGLSVAQRYVELLGGRIWVEDADGGGSVFRFTLEPGGSPQV